jgi:hypothetical protein
MRGYTQRCRQEAGVTRRGIIGKRTAEEGFPLAAAIWSLLRTVLIRAAMKKRIGVLLSGRGSNFEALADSVTLGAYRKPKSLLEQD